MNSLFLARSLGLVLLLSSVLLAAPARAAVINFNNSNFGVSFNFGAVGSFSFFIDVAGVLQPGTVYNNPALNSVSYFVFGSISSTPSGFSSFNLIRDIDGGSFYPQGSAFRFEIAGSADLSDGLQLSELVADSEGVIFSFNAREFHQTPPRYHPPLFELYDDGTGRIQNSNNQGAPGTVNPGSLLPVDVDFGEEYITDLAYLPGVTIAGPQVIPLPAAGWMLLSALGAMGVVRSRRRD